MKNNKWFIRIFVCLISFQMNLNILFSQNENSQNDSIVVEKCLNKALDFEQTNIDSSSFYVDKAYNIAKNSNNLYLKTRTSLATAMQAQYLTDYKKSAYFFQEGIRYAEKLGNKPLLAQGYNGFGNLFGLQKQMSQAAEYFNKALVISKEINDARKVSVILMNLANIEYNNAYYSNNFEKSNNAYKEAYDWAIIAKDTGQQISCLGNWGLSLCDEGKLDLSISKLYTAIDLAVVSKNNSDLIYLYYYLGRTLGSMKSYEKAVESFNKSLNLAIEFKDVDYQSENYYCIAETNYKLGNYKTAYELFVRYKNLEDTISNKEILNELNTIKVVYESEKKQQEIALLKANANKDKITKISLAVGAILLLFLAFLLFNRYRLKSQTNTLLETQNAIISEKNKDISDSINYAKKIQDAILPNTIELNNTFLHNFIISLPKDVVSGDFYWFEQINQYKLFAVADCTGHGVPGAFMSMIGNTLLNSVVNEKKIIRPDLVLNELRNEIIKALKQGEESTNKDGMDVSLICINTETNQLQVACANNPVWIVRTDDLSKVDLIEIKPDKQPIGFVTTDTIPFTLHTLQLNKGDVIYQFSDGFADQFGGEKGKKFKYNQLKQLFLNNSNLPMNTQAEILTKTFFDWKKDLEQIDDVLVTGIKI
jgi:serine phosphatase RsbU (regulator of sigma subunit)